MRRPLAAAALGLCLLALPARADTEFAAYTGPDIVRTGAGGTKVTNNGVDFWTSGTPPMRYRVLGVLTDTRRDRLIDRSMVKSRKIARTVLEAKGDAVIMEEGAPVTGRTPADLGTGTAVRGAGVGFVGSVHRITTRALVVQYLRPDGTRR